jgi:hypothetical protein
MNNTKLTAVQGHETGTDSERTGKARNFQARTHVKLGAAVATPDVKASNQNVASGNSHVSNFVHAAVNTPRVNVPTVRTPTVNVRVPTINVPIRLPGH